MKKALTLVTVVATFGVVALSVPAGASAANFTDLARTECKQEKRTDRADFIRDYGRGAGAINRCIKRELRKAKAECRSEKRFEPAEFRAEYGSGKRAMNRCIRDELR